MLEKLTKETLINYLKDKKPKLIWIKHIKTEEDLSFSIDLKIDTDDDEFIFDISTNVFNTAKNEGQKRLINLSNKLYSLFEEDCVWIDSGSDDIFGYDFNEENALKFLSYIDLDNFELIGIY